MTFSNEECANIMNMYGFCYSNTPAAVKNVYSHILITDCQTGECSAMCTTVSDRLVLSHKESEKNQNDDAMPKHRMTH
jgi:hypothetical protein